MNIMKKVYDDTEFMNIASKVLFNEEFLKTKKIIHHGTTRYDHSVRVAYLSYKLSKIIGGDRKSIIKAGALHDFFLEEYDNNIVKEAKMLVNHPSIAKQNAISYFGVNKKEENIIESHMFPMSNVMPKYKESWIVSIADKIVALRENAMRAKAQVSLWTILILNFLR